ncbi:MAG: hypothetical protein AUI54_03265 [Acidobacteria bacterium 13_1_40CM_2_56_5]|nr:MAG: hypothetical protein AUI54_03265 [Acidobacteria bacterium 13_1_40CM_2_56_5]
MPGNEFVATQCVSFEILSLIRPFNRVVFELPLAAQAAAILRKEDSRLGNDKTDSTQLRIYEWIALI